MGELHLEVYVERMKREFKVEVETGQPQVAYRETIGAEAAYDYTHKKQTGGSGQYAKVIGSIKPLDPNSEHLYEFNNKVTGGRIPKEYIGSVDKGFQDQMTKGTLIGAQVVGVSVELVDGAYHDVDSSEMAFKICAMGAFREAYAQACLLYTSPSPRDQRGSRMPSSA